MSTSRRLLGDITAGRRLLFSAMTGAGLGVVALGLSSCAGDSAAPATPGATASIRVMGGQLPIGGATISIYAAGNSNALLTGTTLADGTFNFTGNQLPCPSASTPVYIVALQGNAGSGPNPAIGLSAGIADCGSLQSPTSFVNVDEVTTVASVWALSQFLDPTGQFLGAPPSGQGLVNAEATIANLADTTSGLAATALANGTAGTPPAATINTLANILSTCVNAASTGTACSQLFAAATPPGATAAPTTTLQAAWNIARNPGFNVGTIFALNPTNGPFTTPQLTGAPPDWTLSVTFTPAGGALGTTLEPFALTVDGGGDVWVANLASQSTINGGLGFVFVMSPTGALSPQLITTNIDRPRGLAIDQQQQLLWVANNQSPTTFNNGAGSVASFSLASGSPIGMFGSVTSPADLAVDPSGNIWSPSTNSNVTEIAGGTTGLPATNLLPELPAGVQVSLGNVAVDSSGNVWLSNSAISNPFLVELPGGSAGAPVQVQGPYLTSPPSKPIAVGPAGDIWSLLQLGGAVLLTKASNYTGVDVGPSTDALSFIATDGAGQAWIWDTTHQGLLVLGANGAAVTGMSGTNGVLISGTARAPLGNIAIDASGNVWAPGTPAIADILEVIGVASPVQTPVIGNSVPPGS